MKFKILPVPNNLKHFVNKYNQILVKDHICTYMYNFFYKLYKDKFVER